jgi:anaerobic ribonucleoside-triphosphate reductase activating protein
MIHPILEIAAVIPYSETNGPGVRSVIWLQGCRKRCTGCFNPEFLLFGKGKKISARSLLKNLKEQTNDFSGIEGITFSGGEPFEQAEALVPLAETFRDNGLSLMGYSGYTLREIQTMGHPYTALLDSLDILVDGNYQAANRILQPWRSSANQTVHFLTDRYADLKPKVTNIAQECEAVIDSGSTVQWTGFPDYSLII